MQSIEYSNLGFYYDQNENFYLERECGPAQSYLLVLLLTPETYIWSFVKIGAVAAEISLTNDIEFVRGWCEVFFISNPTFVMLGCG